MQLNVDKSNSLKECHSIVTLIAKEFDKVIELEGDKEDWEKRFIDSYMLSAKMNYRRLGYELETFDEQDALKRAGIAYNTHKDLYTELPTPLRRVLERSHSHTLGMEMVQKKHDRLKALESQANLGD